MACLNERQKRALQTNLWRWKTVLTRNRRRAMRAYLNLVIYTVILIVLKFVLKDNEVSITATSSITVTSSDPSPSNNFWYEYK